MKLVAGVDGGATQTRVALAETNGKIRGIGISGPSNYGSVSLDKVQGHIDEAFQYAWDQSELSSNNRLNAIFMGMAGVVSEADRKTIRQIVNDLNEVDSQHISVDHDIRISLAGGLAGREGIALIVGTGSSCYGRQNDGCDWMSGGWGHLLDDKGSAYDLVRQSLIAVVRAEDGRGKPTLLSNLMMEGLQIDNISEIMRRLYFEGFRGEGSPMSKEEIASLAPLVTKAAEADDEVAAQIVKDGIQELTLMVRTVADSLNFAHDLIPIVITGGMVQQSGYIKTKLNREIRHEIEASQIYEPIFPPVVGGVLLALQMVGKEIDQEVIRNLTKTTPPKFEKNNTKENWPMLQHLYNSDIEE